MSYASDARLDNIVAYLKRQPDGRDAALDLACASEELAALRKVAEAINLCVGADGMWMEGGTHWGHALHTIRAYRSERLAAHPAPRPVAVASVAEAVQRLRAMTAEAALASARQGASGEDRPLWNECWGSDDARAALEALGLDWPADARSPREVFYQEALPRIRIMRSDLILAEARAKVCEVLHARAAAGGAHE